MTDEELAKLSLWDRIEGITRLIKDYRWGFSDEEFRAFIKDISQSMSVLSKELERTRAK